MPTGPLSDQLLGTGMPKDWKTILGNPESPTGGTGLIYNGVAVEEELPEPTSPPKTDPAAAALARANAAAKASASRQNENTRSLADQQHALLASFGTQRDKKIGNIQNGLQLANEILLQSFGSALEGLRGNLADNDKAESDSSFSNVTNAVRERQDILGEVASQGAGETDLLRAQLQALRNYSSNQGEISRSFFDTLRSVNNATAGLRSDTKTSKTNLFQQAEADKESAWANFYNQQADTWTQIGNIENSNTNVDSDSSVGYAKKYTDAAAKAAEATAGVYNKQGLPSDWNDLGGGKADRELTGGNRAATVNLGGKQKRPEGATLRKW